MSEEILRILHLEDNPADAELIGRELNKIGLTFEKLVVDNKKDFIKALVDFVPDVILCDHALPQFNSIDALAIIKDARLKIPFILITATVSEEFAVEIIKEGADDYLLKDRLQRLPNAMRNALEKSRAEKERKKFLDQLVASEVIYKEAEQLSHFGVWQVDFLRGTAKWSDETYRIFGYSPGKVDTSYENVLNAVHPEDKERVAKIMDETIAGMASNDMVFRVGPFADGSIRYIRSQLRVARDEIGKPVSMTGFNQDITPTRLAELSLEKSEASLRSILENSDTAYVLLDTDANILVYNRMAKELARDEMNRDIDIIKNYIELMDESRRKDVRIAVDTVLSEGRELSYEVMYKMPGGDMWLYVRMHPVFNDAGIILGMIVAATNITKIKQAEQMLKESNERYHLVTKATNDVIWDWDFKSNKIYWSENYEIIFGHSTTNEDFSSWGDHIHPDDKDRVLTGIKQKIAAHDSLLWEDEYRYFTRSGALVYIYDRGYIMQDENNEPVRMVGAMMDITRQKMAEIEQKKITDDLIQRNKDLEQFAYIVSHNVRAPLANIRGFCDALDYQQLNEEEKMEFLKGLSASAKKLDDVLSDLNFILQMKQGVSENKEPVFFSSLVDDIKLSIAQMIEKEKVEIITDFSEVDCKETVKSYLYSIFYNLIINSIKYRRPDVQPVIKITSQKQDNKITLSFKDNGLGIDLKKKGDQVFKLYKRFHLQIEGKGMGLFMTKTQVETLGGKISVKSRVNKGTEFVITFD